MQFQGLGPFGAESVSGSALRKVLACIWVDLGADCVTHWEPVVLCFSVWGVPVWHVDFVCFSVGFRNLSKSHVGQKLKVIRWVLGP